MDNTPIVQVGDAGGQAVEPGKRLGWRHAVRLGGHGVLETFAADVLHNHPGIALIVLSDVVQVE